VKKNRLNRLEYLENQTESKLIKKQNRKNQVKPKPNPLEITKKNNIVFGF
jgi:hypothetical protein